MDVRRWRTVARATAAATVIKIAGLAAGTITSPGHWLIVGAVVTTLTGLVAVATWVAVAITDALADRADARAEGIEQVIGHLTQALAERQQAPPPPGRHLRRIS